MTGCCGVLDAMKGVCYRLVLFPLWTWLAVIREGSWTEFYARMFHSLTVWATAQSSEIQSQQEPVLEMAFVTCYLASSLNSSPTTLFFSLLSPQSLTCCSLNLILACFTPLFPSDVCLDVTLLKRDSWPGILVSYCCIANYLQNIVA